MRAELTRYFYPLRWMNERTAAGTGEWKAHSEAKVGAVLEPLDAHFA